MGLPRPYVVPVTGALICCVSFFFPFKDSNPVCVFIGFSGEKDLDLLCDYAGVLRFDYRCINAIAAWVPQKHLEVIADDPRAAYVERNEALLFRESGLSTRRSLPEGLRGQILPWGVDRIDTELAWAKSRGTGVKVAVLDSGIDYTHEDLAANYAGGIDLWDGDDDPMDDEGHGTKVAGVIAAADNDVGVVGVAPEARLYAVRIGGAHELRWWDGDWATAIAGIDWCAKNGMQIINQSWRIAAYNQTYEAALRAAWDEGCVVVCGTHGYLTRPFTGYGPFVADISPTDTRDSVQFLRTRGTWWDLCAPGVGIPTTNLGGGYTSASGASLAAPHVAGVAALVLAAEPSLSNREVMARLFVTAERLRSMTDKWWDARYGWGLVDAERAVNPPPPPPSSTLESIALLPVSDINHVGLYDRLWAIGTYLNSSQYNLTFDVSWTVQDPSMAAVCWDGSLKGLSVGSTALMASHNGVNSSWATLTVKPASEDIVTIKQARWIYETEAAGLGTLSVTATSTRGGSVSLTVGEYGSGEYLPMVYNKETGEYTYLESDLSCPQTVFIRSSGGGRTLAIPRITSLAEMEARLDAWAVHE